MLKISKVEEIGDKKGKCSSKNDQNKVHIYEFPSRIINEKQKENMLDQIIPSIKQILDRESEQLKNILNISHLDQILCKYGLNYSDLEYKNESRIKNAIMKNENKLHQNFQTKMAKMTRRKANYSKDMKELQQQRMKINFDSLSNIELESSQGIYEDYLYRIQSFDSPTSRIEWLHNQEDKGKFLLYNKILLKIQSDKRRLNFLI